MGNVKVAASQMKCTWDIQKNIEKAENLIAQAAKEGAQIFLLQELFSTPYFCSSQDARFFNLAEPFKDNILIRKFSEVAKTNKIVLPISFFEKEDNCFYNSVAVIDSNGDILGKYRKSHIPQNPGYEEKYYFSNGNTGFKVWDLGFCKIGVGICWDQWFPECARSMALQGADILFYPTAIGSEPQDAKIYSKDHWQTVMRGHAAANLVGIVASNRIGKEKNNDVQLDFYGHSLIIDETGRILKELSNSDEGYVIHPFDISSIQSYRTAWGVFRDRRIDLYKEIIL
mgnify:CR=1 FL=1